MVLFLPLLFVPGAETPPPVGAIDGRSGGAGRCPAAMASADEGRRRWQVGGEARCRACVCVATRELGRRQRQGRTGNREGRRRGGNGIRDLGLSFWAGPMALCSFGQGVRVRLCVLDQIRFEPNFEYGRLRIKCRKSRNRSNKA